MEDTNYRMPLIGDPAPAFEAVTTQGPIKFPEDFKGKWVILFSHPADFTPVCTTEFMTFASMADEFKELNTELVGLSVDSLYAHIAWLRKIQELEWKGMKNNLSKYIIHELKFNEAAVFLLIPKEQPTGQGQRRVVSAKICLCLLSLR